MQQFLNTALSGLTLGMVYAAFALALVLIWRSTRIVNFAQAPMAMLTTFVALVLIDAGYSYWIGFVAALVCGLVLGAVIERVVIRPVEGKAEINAVILTLGLFITLHALASVIFGNRYRSFPAPFGIRGLEVGDATIALTGFGIFTVLAVLVVMGLLVALFRFTDLGLRMRASAFNQEVARLLGVRVGRMLTLGWALASLVGSLAGLLIAGGSLVHPSYMDSVVVYGFVAAVLGGLDSPAGAVVGGLVLGLSLSFVSGYVGSELVALASLVILMVVLTLRPGGLFAQHRGAAGLMRDRLRGLWRGLDPRPAPPARPGRVAGRGSRARRPSATSAVSSSPSMAYLGIAAGGLTVLTGLNGQISLGHGALMAIGAYTTALLLPDREASTPLPVVVLVAIATTLAVGTLVGVAAARLHGPYLAGATLALAVAVPGIALFFEERLGGEQGLSVVLPDDPRLGRSTLPSSSPAPT